MPSPESDRRSVPLDLFSASLISGIDVAKSYRPDLPGAFGGGNVNIRTKLYPSKTIYKIKLGTGVSGNLSPGDNFQRNTFGNVDFFGFDRGQSRDLLRDHRVSQANLWRDPYNGAGLGRKYNFCQIEFFFLFFIFCFFYVQDG